MVVAILGQDSSLRCDHFFDLFFLHLFLGMYGGNPVNAVFLLPPIVRFPDGSLLVSGGFLAPATKKPYEKTKR